LWDRTTHRQLAALTGPAGPVSSVAFRPDGKTLATGGANGATRLWDVATHSPGDRLPTGPTGRVSSVAFSPDGATLAAASANGVWLWALPSPCNCLTSPTSAARLPGPAGAFNSVAFSPDNTAAFSPDDTILAAGRGDGTVQLWDRATHRKIASLTSAPGTVTSVAFSPNGTTLAASRADHTVRLWGVGLPMRLCESAGRSLTRAEWARYVPVLAYQKVCP